MMDSDADADAALTSMDDTPLEMPLLAIDAPVPDFAGTRRETGGRAAAGGMLEGSNSLIMDLPVVMKVVLGSARMALANVAKLSKGSIVKLDKKVGEPVDIVVNGRLIARGEVVVLDQEGNRFGVVLTEVGSQTPLSKAGR